MSQERTHRGTWVFLGLASGLMLSPCSALAQGLEVRSVAVEPSNNAVIYVATTAGVVKSTDGGATWLPRSTTLLGRWVHALAIDPVTPATLYAGTDSGVFKSTDGAATWATSTAGISAAPVRALAIDPTNTAQLYAGTGEFYPATGGGGLFKSTDAGTTWTSSNSGLLGAFGPAEVRSIVVDPMHPSTLYAGTERDWIFKTTNAGTSWTSLSQSGIAGTLQLPVWTSVALSAANPGLLYGISQFYERTAVFKTSDGGATWSDTLIPALDGFVSNSVPTLAVDPGTAATLYAGGAFAPDNLLKSINGGANWTPAHDGLSGWVTGLTIDPAVPLNLYAGTYSGGLVFKSTDAGGSWQDVGFAEPFAFASGFVPPTGSISAGEEGVVKAETKLRSALFSCYRKGVENLFAGRPDGVSACVSDPTKGARAKYDKAVSKLVGPKKIVPACLDSARVADAEATWEQLTEPFIWCDGDTALPAQFFGGNGKVPDDAATMAGEDGVAKAAAKLYADLTTCYRKGRQNQERHKPDGVEVCVRDPIQGALAKYDRAIAKLIPPNKVVPSCLDPAAVRTLVEGSVGSPFCAF